MARQSLQSLEIKDRNCRRIDFFGFAPGVSLRHCTSIVFVGDCFLLRPDIPIPVIEAGRCGSSRSVPDVVHSEHFRAVTPMWSYWFFSMNLALLRAWVRTVFPESIEDDFA